MNDQQQTTLQQAQQRSLWDIFTERDAAVDQVEQNANSEWKQVAYLTAIEVGQRQGTFTSEDVWDAISGVTTHEPRAMGAVMRRLRKENVITPTDTFVISTSPLGHGRPSRVWRFIQGGEQQTSEQHDRPVTDRPPYGTNAPCESCNKTYDIGFYYRCPFCGAG